MNEAKVKEIYNATSLKGYTHTELRQADLWTRDYALTRLEQHLKDAGVTVAMKEYVILMAGCHYGSIETDGLLIAHQCYPEWLK